MRSFCVFVLTIALSASVFAIKPPQWGAIYTVSGTLNIPYAEISEPFSAWYDTHNKRSRIDYYGGMVKTYQFENKRKYGVSFKIVPVPKVDYGNNETCLERNGTAEKRTYIQPSLPDVSDFKFVGKEKVLGMQCHKFRFVVPYGTMKDIYTIWVRYQKLRKCPWGYQPIPVRYEKKGYETLLGSIYDHFQMDYESYSIEDVPNKVFEMSPYRPCNTVPARNDSFANFFNPMEEFIHPTTDHHLEMEFSKFKAKHEIQYMNESEHEFRKNIFRQNLRYINSKNRAGMGYSLAVNHLADKTENEMKVLSGYRPSGDNNMGKPFPYNTQILKKKIPKQFDWRLRGAVTPVRQQSVCGSCWAFAAVGAIEGAFFLKNGSNLVRFSPQALIDCSWKYGNYGCDGGDDSNAYKWIMKKGGIPTEEDYGSYLAQDGFCHVDSVPKVAKISRFVKVTPRDPNDLKLALIKNGPLSVAIDAAHKSFRFYSHGVYKEPECKNATKDLNHVALAVGYGKIKEEDYWLLKNSWSTKWGNDGYILMSAKDNNCGVMTEPKYVEIA